MFLTDVVVANAACGAIRIATTSCLTGVVLTDFACFAICIGPASLGCTAAIGANTIGRTIVVGGASLDAFQRFADKASFALYVVTATCLALAAHTDFPKGTGAILFTFRFGRWFGLAYPALAT